MVISAFRPTFKINKQIKFGQLNDLAIKITFCNTRTILCQYRNVGAQLTVTTASIFETQLIVSSPLKTAGENLTGSQDGWLRTLLSKFELVWHRKEGHVIESAIQIIQVHDWTMTYCCCETLRLKLLHTG